MDLEPRLVIPTQGKYYVAEPRGRLAKKQPFAFTISSPLPYQASDLMLFGGSLPVVSNQYVDSPSLFPELFDTQFYLFFEEVKEGSKSSGADFFSLENFRYRAIPNFNDRFSRITGHPCGYTLHMEAQLQRYVMQDFQISFRF